MGGGGPVFRYEGEGEGLMYGLGVGRRCGVGRRSDDLRGAKRLVPDSVVYDCSIGMVPVGACSLFCSPALLDGLFLCDGVALFSYDGLGKVYGLDGWDVGLPLAADGVIKGAVIGSGGISYGAYEVP